MQGEVTDIKISCDGKYFASSATDTVIRVWSLEAATLGHPVAVLMGSEKVVNFLDWSPVIPNILASVDADGACRVWDAAATAEEPVILRPSPTFGHLASRNPLSTRALRTAVGVDPVTGTHTYTHHRERRWCHVFLSCCAADTG